MRNMIVAGIVVAGLTIGLGLKAAAPPPIRAAKELTIVEPSGKQTLLSSYKGKVVMLACVFTTCPHCQALSSQVMQKLQADLGPSGFQAIDVAFNDEVGTPDKAVNAKVAANFKQQFAPTYPVGYATRDTIMNFLGLSIVDVRWVVPQVVIIDKKGMIRAQSKPSGSEELQTESSLRELIGDLLKEGGSAGSKGSSNKATPKKADKKTT